MIYLTKEFEKGIITSNQKSFFIAAIYLDKLIIYIQSIDKFKNCTLKIFSIDLLQMQQNDQNKYLIRHISTIREQYAIDFDDISYIFFEPTIYTLIPLDLYNQNNDERYIQFLISEKTKELNFYLSFNQPNLSAQLICSFSKFFKNIYETFSDSVKIITPVDNILSFVLRINEHLPFAVIRMQSTYFDLYIKKNSELLLVNRFHFMVDTEIFYFIQHAIESTGIKTSETLILITGEYSINSPLTQFILEHFYGLKLLCCPAYLNHIPQNYKFFDILCHTFE